MNTFLHTASMALGRSHRVMQDKGPFEIKFKDNKYDQTFYQYINIDGEYFKLKNPDTIIVKQAEIFKNGKI